MVHLASPTPSSLSPWDRILSPFQRFALVGSSGGLVLIACTIAALIWANSPFAASYESIWDVGLEIGWGGYELRLSLHHFINDGLMAVFFFMVGLEIKREFMVGELASARKAALPIAAAFGGIVVPAGIYAVINAGTPGAPGWGIPMATDIAFALGVLALLGPRAPLALKIFLAALAIVDDIGAVLVIAAFYTEQISVPALTAAGVILLGMIALNRMGARHPGFYLLFGVGLWFAFLQSGIHATIAGVIAAMTIPARTRIDTDEFLTRGKDLMQRFDDAGVEGKNVLTNHDQQAVIQTLENACEDAQAPLQRIEHDIQLWVAFAIIPLFALANAGVNLSGDIGAALLDRVTLGVILGLVVGKPVGITFFAWLAVRSGMAALPVGVTWSSIHGVSWLGGIGFTMSLFIANLAFTNDALRVEEAKIGILVASLIAGLVGWMIIRRGAVPHPAPAPGD